MLGETRAREWTKSQDGVEPKEELDLSGRQRRADVKILQFSFPCAFKYVERNSPVG